VTSSSIQSSIGLLKVPPEAFTVTGSQGQNKAHRHFWKRERERVERWREGDTCCKVTHQTAMTRLWMWCQPISSHKARTQKAVPFSSAQFSVLWLPAKHYRDKSHVFCCEDFVPYICGKCLLQDQTQSM